MSKARHSPRRGRPTRDAGFVLIGLIAIITMGALYFLMVQLEEVGNYQRQARLAASGGTPVDQARESLLAYAATYRDDPSHSTEVFGYLPCPDTDGDGQAESTCSSAGNAAIGLLPYKTLGLTDLRDSDGNCLWYAVSGRLKNNPKDTGSALNWDVQGQFSVTDANGSALVAPEDSRGGAAAVIFSSGAPLATQSRSGSGAGPCGIDPSQFTSYLDGNYNFATSTTIALTQGPVTNAGGTITNNDKLAWISPKEIFDRIIVRKDFSNPLTSSPPGQINTLADRIKAALDLRIQNDIFNGTTTSRPTNYASYTPKPSGIYTGEVDPAMDIGVQGQTSYANYLSNWAEPFRLAVCDSLSTPCLSINNGGTANCRGSLVLGGRTASGQPRTAAQKGSSLSILANYFESGSGTGGQDLLTGSGSFVGASAFSQSSPAADSATCLGYGTFVSLASDSAQFASGTVTPGGGGSAVTSVTGGASPEIVLGSTTANSRAGCVWYPTALPLESSLRVYYKYRIDSATAGSSARGYALALADATTNSPYRSDPLMCGARGTTRLGYAGAPVSGTARVLGTTQTIAATSWSYSTGRATITTAQAHGFFAGDTVTIAGAFPTGYNGTYTIVSTSGFPATNFTYSVAYPGTPRAGIAPPKIAVEFDTFPETLTTQRNDPSAEHFAFLYWGSAGDNNMTAASTTQDGSDDNYHGDGVTGDGSQPLNPRGLTTTSATATALATVAAARWTGGTATITTSAPHGITNGQRVVVSDTSPLGYKGTYTATVPVGDATHFTYPIASNPGAYPYVATVAAAAWAGGTATVTTSAAHGLSTGASVSVSNVAPSAWNGNYTVTVIDATRFSYSLATNPGTYVSGGQVSYPQSLVSSASWSGGVVTMTTAAAHNLVSNQYVTITGILPSAYNGTYRVTVTDATHFTYALTDPATNPGAYVSGGLVAVAGITSTVMAGTATNITATTWSTAGTVTANTAAAHGLAIGQTVYVSGVTPTGYNGTYAVTSVPSSTRFTYALANAGLAAGTAFGVVAVAAPASATISSAAWSSTNGGTATLATSAAHGFTNGQIVNIGGISPGGYNGAYAITVIDATHFSYSLATDPGGSFAAATFATPGIATVKSSDPLLPYNGAMPFDTDIHVRLDVSRSYDAAKRQATLTLRAYVGDNFSTGSCDLSDFQNFSRDLSALCPIRTPTVEQNGIVVNDIAGPALSNVYFGYSTARGNSSNDNQAIHIRNLILRSQ
jgi:hypothetical protein